MGIFKGGALRLFQTFLYALLFCCAAIILGIYSYFLSVLADRNEGILTQWKAVEGLSGAATLYLIFAVLLTCCLGGISVLAFLAIVLDVLFCGALIAVAILTRRGAHSCSGIVSTPIGYGYANEGAGFDNTASSDTGRNVIYAVHLGTACRLNTAAFAVSIIGAFLFLITAALQVALVRHHRKEKRFGPSPDNNYTAGYGNKKKGLFSRRSKNSSRGLEKDTELGTTGTVVGAAGEHNHQHNGSTTVAGTTPYDQAATNGSAPTHSTHGGYYTQPQGTGVNPYGYDNNVNTTTSTHTNTVGPTYTTSTATNY